MHSPDFAVDRRELEWRAGPLCTWTCQVGASFRNADVAYASRDNTENMYWLIFDPDSRVKRAWTVMTSIVLLYTVFWVRDSSTLVRPRWTHHRAPYLLIARMPFVKYVIAFAPSSGIGGCIGGGACRKGGRLVICHNVRTSNSRNSPVAPPHPPRSHPTRQPLAARFLLLHIQVPYSFSFNNREERSVVIVDLVCDSVFMMDVLFQFRVSYRDGTEK